MINVAMVNQDLRDTAAFQRFQLTGTEKCPGGQQQLISIRATVIDRAAELRAGAQIGQSNPNIVCRHRQAAFQSGRKWAVTPRREDHGGHADLQGNSRS
jgi:hypothetical protein